MLTVYEKIATAIAMCIVLAGHLNSNIWHVEVLGILSGKIVIWAYLPLAAVLFWVLRRQAKEVPEDRE